ncbi:MAG: hypothetical protein M1465_00685 [Candidatus Marsarchaeota archaeon]|nr:hypothetical protein [Candidatus Marsarchaeota archaeon]
MGIKMWYYKHFDEDKLLEELSKPDEGEYVAVKEGNMVTRVRKEELEEYMRMTREKTGRYADK